MYRNGRVADRSEHVISEAIVQDMVGHGAQFLVARFSMVPDAIFTTQSEGTGALDGKSPSITKMVVLGGD